MEFLKRIYHSTVWLFLPLSRARAYERKYLHALLLVLIPLGLFCFSSSAHAAYSVDSSSSYFGSYGTTSLTSATTTIAGGDALIVGCTSESNPQNVLSISDTLGTNFTTSSFQTDSGSNAESIVVSGIPFSGNDKITCSIAGAPAYTVMYVYVVGGLKNSGGNLVEDFATSTIRSDNVMGGAFTNSYPNDFLFMNGITQSGSPNSTTGCGPVGSCFPDRSQLSAPQPFYAQYGSVDSITTDNFTQGWTTFAPTLSTMAAFECNGNCVGGGGGGGGGSGSGTIEFLYPSSSSVIYPPMPYIYTGVTGITNTAWYQDTVTICTLAYANCNVYPLVHFLRPNASPSSTYVQQWANTAESYDYGSATSTLVGLHAILKDGSGNILSQTQLSFRMQTFLHGSINPNGTSTVIDGIPLIDASGTYHGITVTSTWTGIVIPTFNTTSSSWCAPAVDWTDLGGSLNYAACSTANWLFNPSVAGNNDLSVAFSNFVNTPPFAYVTTIFNAFEAQGVALQSTTSSDLSFNLNASGDLPSIVPNQNVVLLSASTTYGVFGSHATAFLGMLFTAEDSIMTLWLLFFIYKTITKPRKEFH